MMTAKTASVTRNDLTTLLAKLETYIDSADINEKVEIGAILWSFIERAGKAMNPIKDALREETLAKTQGEGSETFQGLTPESSCTVRVPRPTLKISKMADMDAMKQTLGGRFDKLFSTTTSYKPTKDFEDKVFMLGEDEVDLVMGIIERVENTPRVSFNK
mgnify:CR=1 FL=1